jgi:hypothetical protein
MSAEKKGASPGTVAWDILEKDFLQAFIDYADEERARDELKRLAMQGDAVDKYITPFEQLARRASLESNDPSNLRTFTRGLPRKLAESCLVFEKSQNIHTVGTRGTTPTGEEFATKSDYSK